MAVKELTEMRYGIPVLEKFNVIYAVNVAKVFITKTTTTSFLVQQVYRDLNLAQAGDFTRNPPFLRDIGRMCHAWNKK
ncbi:MAG: hypothetical protein ABSA79_08995 [Candidatus Bathyarchaeia archaeon]